MADVLPLKRFSIAAAMMAAAVGAFVLMQARQAGSPAPSAAGGSARDDHGRNAAVPEAIPFPGLRDVFWRVFHGVLDDRVTLIAAGVTFYLLLALFPAIGALVALYGLVADPITISQHLRELAGLMPPGAFDLLADQMKELVNRRDSTLGITFFVGLGIALWSTHSGTLAIFNAMNVASEETEKRGLVRLNLIALCFTLCAMLLTIIMVVLVGVMPVVLSYLWLDQFKEHMALLLRWRLLLLVVAVAVTSVYRFGSSREPAKLRWMTWGAVLTTVAWACPSASPSTSIISPITTRPTAR